MGGITMNEMKENASGHRRAVVSAVFFVLGLSTVFLILGFTASVFGAFFLQNQERFAQISGIVVIVFGLHFLGILRIPLLNREARLDAGDQGGSSFGAYVLGLAFAFGWTPCLGPVLSAILGLAASSGDLARGTMLLGVYALGLGIPFLLVAAFFPRLTGVMAFMRRHMGRIERISGLMLWTLGLMMLTGQFTAFSRFLLDTFPVLQTLG